MPSIIDELKRSPLFNISLCSKELSHSNFWAWLMEINVEGNHPFVEVFYPDFYQNKNRFKCVEREKKNIDLKINYTDSEGQDKCFLIENKIKSIPTIKQLKEYQDKTKNYDRGILTGIEDTLGLPSKKCEWLFLSYAEIGKRIERINNENKTKINSFVFQTINCYHNDISNISKLLISKLKNENNRYLSSEYVNDFEKIRFGDVLLKLNASRFKEYLDNRIKEDQDELRSKFGDPFVSIDFSHKESIITIVYREAINPSIPLDDDSEENEKGRIGVQIQGKQFRIYAGPTNSDSNRNEKVLKRDLTDCGWLESYSENKVRGKKTAMRENPGYCKYQKHFLHMYQYWTITEDEQAFDYLYGQIKNELIMARTLIDLGKIHF